MGWDGWWEGESTFPLVSSPQMTRLHSWVVQCVRGTIRELNQNGLLFKCMESDKRQSVSALMTLSLSQVNPNRFTQLHVRIWEANVKVKWPKFRMCPAARRLKGVIFPIHRSPDVWSASGPAKNWTYRGVELTSKHFTVINPHLGLFGPSKFWTYIQNWTYIHGSYISAPV